MVSKGLEKKLNCIKFWKFWKKSKHFVVTRQNFAQKKIGCFITPRAIQITSSWFYLGLIIIVGWIPSLVDYNHHTWRTKPKLNMKIKTRIKTIFYFLKTRPKTKFLVLFMCGNQNWNRNICFWKKKDYN